MWGGSEPGLDPGGTEGGDQSTGSSNQELIDLKDQFEQQQVLIAQLKEMLRKTEQKNVTEEKVEEYANTLTRMSARVKKNRMKRGDISDESITDTPASEKIMLLRQQLEENKLRLAQRGKFQKGIEETVTQLKAQLDDSQQLINQTPLNLSFAETKTENYSIESSSEELFNILVNKDRKLTELNNKVQKLEANVIDLQENLKEKDSVIDARTKAITLMTESLSRKGKNTLDALDDTKEQMRKMQENFVALEMEMKEEKQGLLKDLDNKKSFITTLQDSYYSLQNTNEFLQNDIEMYKARLANSENGDTKSLLNRITNLESELTQKTVDLETLSNELKQKNEDFEKLQHLHSSVQDNCIRLQEELKSIRNNDNVSSELETLKSRIAELEELNSELTKSSSDALSPRDSPQRSSKKGKRGQKTTLKLKDASELQKLLDKSKEECEQYRMKVVECDLTIQELNLTINDLQKKQEVVKEEPEDLVKLKKQLDDSNKNMIKIKAQHKSKIKELNKKIDELKNSGDDKEKLIELQNENTKLKEQIDGLEKENQKLLSNSATDTKTKEHIKELEAQLFEQSELLDTKDQSLDTLEAQLKSYKMELSSLSERFNKLSHVENDQVASEMTSIHFEEQLDKLQLEKKDLKEKNDLITLEKESLLEKIESILKEKQEISTKLENYMQENMDLIDKLEKLSTEKVSSAESIEIMEGLTQQEKLELEAYQHSLELASGNVNDNLQNPELNESVNQLTEETCDLLQKIELFTEERREVMEKMEALAAENNQLNMKIQEIENNRDILTETYEQLQNEKEVIEQQLNSLKVLEIELHNDIAQLKKENEVLKNEMKQGGDEQGFEQLIPLENEEQKNNELQKQIDEYRSLIEIQKCEINELKVELLSHRDLPAANRELHEKITALQADYGNLMSENDKLNKTIKEQSLAVQEKNKVEQELVETKKRIDDFNKKLEENFNELENYKSIIEENKYELVSSSNIILDLQSKVQEKENEISHYVNEVTHLNSVIAELNSALSHLENENQKQNDYSNTIEMMSTQLQELKILLNENINQIEVYQSELQENSETINKLNIQLKEVNNKLLNMEHELQCKDDEISKLIKERDNKELMIINLQSELKEREENFQKICQSLNDKYIMLQNQIVHNAESLEKLSKVEQLETKNKEQLEKMKKIAANLKKKTAAYTELEQKYNALDGNCKEQENVITQLKSNDEMQETKIKSLVDKLEEIGEELSVKTNNLNALTQEITYWRTVYEELQNSKQQFEAQLHALRTESEMLTSDESNRLNMEINEKNDIIRNLNQQLEDSQYHAQTNSNALQAKIQEMEMVVENQEMELTKYKEKVGNLEEIVSTVEERRLSLENTSVELREQLLEKSHSYKKISEAKDMLEQRLAAFMQHDEQIGNRLHESLVENQELLDRNQHLVNENELLKQHLSSVTEKNLEIMSNLDQFAQMQNEILKQRDIITELEVQNKHIQEDNKKKLKQKMNEVESLETELQNQLQVLEDERKSLLIQCEHLRDQVNEYAERQVQLQSEIEQNKQKLDQQQIDFEEHIEQFEKLNEENKHNLGMIEQYSVNCQRLTNENEELQNTVILKNLELQEQQKNCIQLEERLQEEKVKLELLERNLEEGKTTMENITSTYSQPISTFVWPDNTSNDPFDFVTKSEVFVPLVQTVNEPLVQYSNEPFTETSTAVKCSNSDNDLINKIKTLEFMLYDTEKEKDDVLLQCQELTNEIARLIYVKQQTTQVGAAEGKPVLFDYFTNSEETQLCAKCKEPIVTYNLQSDLDSQILSSKQTAITQTDLKQLHELEFGKTKPCVDVLDSGKPIEEEVCNKKTAFVCYPGPEAPVEDKNNQPQQSIDAFDENNDGWCCGADEAILEEDHRQKMNSSILNQNASLHIEELEEKIRAFEIDRERHLEEIKQLQIKSGKLIKKLKEFKVANEKLNAEIKRTDFSGLDDAIQDELKSQIEHLEKRIKETNTELQKEKLQKTNLLQKIQNLEAANNRMSEAKEKHEIDFIVMQRQNHELLAKLEQFEWGNEVCESSVSTKELKTEKNVSINVLENNIRELNETIDELTLYNQELQMSLEEQKRLLSNAEMGNKKSESDYLQIVSEKNVLSDELISVKLEKEKAEEQLNTLANSHEELQSYLNLLTEEKRNLKDHLSRLQSSLQSEKQNLESKTSLSFNELEASKQKIFELTEQVQNLESSYQQLQSENSKLCDVNTTLASLQENNNTLIVQLQQQNDHVQELSAALIVKDEKISEIENLLQKSEEVSEENKRLIETLKLKDAEISEKSAQLEQADVERKSYAASLQQLADEWNQRVDQRGQDVAESWKLHLESQETEFMNIQKQLQKEVQDLQEKCNSLDNENNELRKNVDAEIRNEVDKISALQQQINTGQIYINELTQTLQKNQEAISEQQQKITNYDASISLLNEQIEKKDAELSRLHNQISALESEIEAQKTYSRELIQKLDAADNLQRQLDEDNNIINKLRQELNVKQQEYTELHAELQHKNTEFALLTDSLNETNSLRQSDFNKMSQLETQIQGLSLQLQEKIDEVDLLNNQISYYTQTHLEAEQKDVKIKDLTNEIIKLKADIEERDRQLDNFISADQSKDNKVSELTIEINNLKFILSEKEKEYNYQLEVISQESLQKQIELKHSHDKLLIAKDSDLEILNSQLLEQIQNNEAFNSILQQRDVELNEIKIQLDSKMNECEELNNKLFEEEELHKEEDKQVNELGRIIEDQVLKIESLQQELFEKSKDYDSLIAELDLRKPSSEQRPIYELSQELLPTTDAVESESTSEQSLRAELDIALYVLHQRDVRCEELTVELLQLLEERDTLQLKLSNSIREKEELRRTYVPDFVSESANEEISKTYISSSNPTLSTLINETGESSKRKLELTDPLINKLSELKSVGYQKDKTLVDEQEERRLLHMSLMQQHQNIASMLPPEAAARLVQDASYTLSRQVQSPSKVLLNWLWGRSTPKVNDV